MGIPQLLIAGDANYGTTAASGSTKVANPSELGTGCYGIFKSNGALLDSSTASGADLETALADCKEFFIAVKETDGTINATPMLQRRGVVDYRAAEYAAAVRQVTNVVLSTTAIFQTDSAGTLATSPTAYTINVLAQEVTVKVIDTKLGTHVMNNKSYSYQIPNTSATNTSVVAALKAIINADPDRIVEASNSGTATTLTLTDKRDGGTFRLSLSGPGMELITPTYTTAFDPGSGTVDQLKAIEGFSQARSQGVMNQTGGRGLLPFVSQTVAGETYDMYFLDVVNTSPAMHGMNAMNGREFNIIFAIPDDSSLEATSQDVFEATIKAVLAPYAAASDSGLPEVGSDSID